MRGANGLVSVKRIDIEADAISLADLDERPSRLQPEMLLWVDIQGFSEQGARPVVEALELDRLVRYAAADPGRGPAAEGFEPVMAHLGQFEARDADKEYNLGRIEELASRAASAGAALLPGMCQFFRLSSHAR